MENIYFFYNTKGHKFKPNLKSLITVFFISFIQISAAGNFELEILEISNTNSHLLTGYCCGVPLEIRSTKTTGE